MANFLTRLIERSRDLAPREQRGQRVEPLIAPFYAAGPNTALPDDPLDDVMNDEPASVAKPQSLRRTAALDIAETTAAQRPAERIAPSPRRREPADKASLEIKPARAMADESQRARINQTSGIEPLPRTPKSTLPPALLVNARPGLTDPADQSRRANHGPLVIRPQVARADESISRVSDAVNEANDVTAAPVIRVTIGRVDVRAVSREAPPARRATPPTPKLTLEEYLRSRNGGKR